MSATGRAAATPTPSAMTSSSGQRLCDVGSCAVSILIRTIATATTATAIIDAASQDGAARVKHSSNARAIASSSQGVIKASGRLRSW
jgi:hypothetical protein